MEIWKNIAGYEGYQVSSLGNVRSLRRKTPHVLKPCRNLHSAYLQVWLFKKHRKKDQLFIHRLVAKAFVPNPENKPQVNHVNGNKFDNRAENLEWVTASENQRHAVAIGLKTSGEDCKWAKLTSEQVRLIRSLYKPRDKEFGVKALAKKFGLGFGTVQRLVHGESYKNAGGIIHKKFYRRREAKS